MPAVVSEEPAPGYLPFVESHLDRLRRDAERLAGEGLAAEEVVCGALTDVALRWQWFELLRIRLGRTDPAGEYLDAALVRRCTRSQPETPESPVDVTVTEWKPPSPALVSVTVWTPQPPAWASVPEWTPGPDHWGWTPPPTTATSAAVRMALVSAPPPQSASALLEAAIAWVHAYETYNRYRRVAAAVLVVFVLLLLTQLGLSAMM
jgi:hypothetical protein